jgi:hypothetical protein
MIYAECAGILFVLDLRGRRRLGRWIRLPPAGAT